MICILWHLSGYICLISLSLDRCVSCRAAISKVLAFELLRPLDTFLLWFCNLVYCRIGATSAPWYTPCNSLIRLLAYTSVLSTEGLGQSRHWSQIEDTFGGAFPKSSTHTLLCLQTNKSLLLYYNRPIQEYCSWILFTPSKVLVVIASELWIWLSDTVQFAKYMLFYRPQFRVL